MCFKQKALIVSKRSTTISIYCVSVEQVPLSTLAGSLISSGMLLLLRVVIPSQVSEYTGHPLIMHGTTFSFSVGNLRYRSNLAIDKKFVLAYNPWCEKLPLTNMSVLTLKLILTSHLEGQWVLNICEALSLLETWSKSCIHHRISSQVCKLTYNTLRPFYVLQTVIQMRHNCTHNT